MNHLKTGDLILFDNGGCNPLSLLIKYFVANIVSGNVWVGQMDEKVLKEWTAKNESIEYIF